MSFNTITIIKQQQSLTPKVLSISWYDEEFTIFAMITTYPVAQLLEFYNHLHSLLYSNFNEFYIALLSSGRRTV